jgi:hypothetical protein
MFSKPPTETWTGGPCRSPTSAVTAPSSAAAADPQHPRRIELAPYRVHRAKVTRPAQLAFGQDLLEWPRVALVAIRWSDRHLLDRRKASLGTAVIDLDGLEVGVLDRLNCGNWSRGRGRGYGASTDNQQRPAPLGQAGNGG